MPTNRYPGSSLRAHATNCTIRFFYQSDQLIAKADTVLSIGKGIKGGSRLAGRGSQSVIVMCHSTYEPGMGGGGDMLTTTLEVDSLKTNPKRFWSFIKAIKQENIGIPTLRVNDQPIINDRNKANALNNQFSSVFTQEKHPIPQIAPSILTPTSPFSKLA